MYTAPNVKPKIIAIPMKKLLILIVVASIIAAFALLDGQQYLNPALYKDMAAQQPETVTWVYFIAYIIITALSIPGAAIMTLIGGALFGLTKGLLLASFASSIGATLAFLVSRTLLRDWVQNNFGSYLARINQGIEKDGAFYLFSLRLIPAIPFFAINLVMGLTPIRTFTFYMVSQIGMLLGTAVYVNAGVQIGNIDELSLSGILSAQLVIGFILLAIMPFIAKSIVNSIQQQRVYKTWKQHKPKQFDVNMVVIGAGSAGLVASLIAAAVKAKVVLIEKHQMGGDCLNTGCVPSKAILRSAKMAHYNKRGAEFGLDNSHTEVNFSKVMQRVQNVISRIEPHDSVERFTGLGVDVVIGEAEIISPWEVKVGDRRITTKNIIISSGASPFVPPIKGIDKISPLTSENLWSLTEQPKKLLVMGGGPIGCELAQAFQRLGSEVTLIEALPRILPREDEDVAAAINDTFKQEGIHILAGHKVISFDVDNGQQYAQWQNTNDETGTIAFDQVIVATGRKANLNIPGMQLLDLNINPNGTLEVDDYLRTKYPNIYACGDVTGPYQFTHTASHQAWFTSVNALFGKFKKFKVDYSVIPWATFIDPEVATVGLTELAAKEKNIAYEVTRYDIDDLDRAIADSEDKGFIKVLTVPGKDKILGVTIVGYHASTIIAEYVMAMRHNLGLNKILGTIHIYPTLTETNKFVAGQWKREHAPEKLLQWVEKFHNWMR